MDANSISERSIEKFVRKIFNSDRNFESLTKADLRNKYLKEKGITEFSVEEKKLFSSVVNEVFDEFTKSIKTSNKCLLDEASCDSKKRSGKSKSATPKRKIVNSDDEMDSGIFDSGHNKENVESVEIDKNTSAENGDFSDEDVSKNCNSGSPLVSESGMKLDDRKQVDNAKLKDLPNNDIESHHVESSSEADGSDDDFVMRKNPQKAKTQLNSSVCDSDSDDNSDAEGNNSDQSGTAPAKKQKNTRQEIKQNTNEKREVSESDDEISDQSSTSDEKKKSKLETSRKRKARKPLNPKHQNESDVSSGSESESEFQEEQEKNNRKNKQSKLDEAPKNSKNKRKISESDGESSDQESMSNENKKSKKKNKFETSKKRKIQKPLNPKHQNGSDVSSANESESEFREEKTNGKNRKSKPSEASKKSKNSPPSNSRIEHIKKYIRAAGLRIQSYSKLFESCRSQKAKVEKLLEVLQNAGLKGRPTLEKCKKLKKKIEEKKDIESLDLTNIIETKGRPRRNASKHHLFLAPSSPSPMETTEAPPANHFGNLKGIVDSDDSDAPVKTSSRKRTVIDEDDSS